MLRERRRAAVQRRLDAGLDAAARNRAGRFSTPPGLAAAMLRMTSDTLAAGERVRLLDPALGTGVFFSAALEVLGTRRLAAALGFEIDAGIAAECRALWGGHGLTVKTGDFCSARPPRTEAARAGLIVCNPPYVRHHHLSVARKRELATRADAAVNGLAGLSVYFLLIAHAWLRRGGVGVWIVPAEILDAGYGAVVRGYLTERVTLLRAHRFDPEDTQFPDALVSSVIVVFRNTPPAPGAAARLTSGAADAPDVTRSVSLRQLRRRTKWGPVWTARPRAGAADATTIGDLFSVRRGLATGANAFFILDRAEAMRLELPDEFLRPVLPGPRHVPDRVVERDPDGFPAGLPQRVLLDCPLGIGEVRGRYPTLFRYLQRGRRRGLHDRYLLRRRRPWFAQERRPAAPILCTYMGRRRGGRPIRFIRNRSDATATNVYHLLYPRQRASVAALERLFDRMRETEQGLEAAGRTYGGGLVKIEPKELAAVTLKPAGRQ